MSTAGLLAMALLINPLPMVRPAYSQISCVETSSCPTNGTTPLNLAIMPYTQILGDWFDVLIWAVIVVVFAIRFSPLYAALIGFFIASFFAGTSTVFNDSAAGSPKWWAIVLAGLCFGSALFILIRSRINNPINA